jgi:AraC family transcriptional regulator
MEALRARDGRPAAPWVADASGEQRHLKGHCSGMDVSYLGGSASGEKERVRDTIEILIPGENAALAAATYRMADGRQRTAFVRAPLISVIPPGQPYAVHCRHPSDVLVLSLEPQFFQHQARVALGAGTPDLQEPYAAVDPFIRELGNTLHSDLQSDRYPSPAYLESLAGVIAIHVARNYRVAPFPSQRGQGRLPTHKLNRVHAYIMEHIAEPIRVEHLAAEVHLSPFHFARTFKQATGQAPHLYVLMQRVEYAKELLKTTELSLVNVAFSSGFRTQGHFTGVFHRYTGFTPRVYRLNCRAALSMTR